MGCGARGPLCGPVGMGSVVGGRAESRWVPSLERRLIAFRGRDFRPTELIAGHQGSDNKSADDGFRSSCALFARGFALHKYMLAVQWKVEVLLLFYKK